MKTYLNLGCGERFHPDWTNIDVVASGPNVIVHDVTNEIPFSVDSADVIYHAAMFEHLRKADALKFLRECLRVLKPGGIIRVGVPDLEQICRMYLAKLESALAAAPGAAEDYDWMMLEMLDQVVRERSGGDMMEYLRKIPLPNEEFVYERIGNEGRKLVSAIRSEVPQKPQRPDVLRLVNRRVRAVLRKIRAVLLTQLAGPDAARALAIGRFRLGGEAHQWMYDRFSLARLMLEAGFHEPTVRSATESAIPQWSQFHLDTPPDGTLYKPDLLFMEAIKPQIRARK